MGAVFLPSTAIASRSVYFMNVTAAFLAGTAPLAIRAAAFSVHRVFADHAGGLSLANQMFSIVGDLQQGFRWELFYGHTVGFDLRGLALSDFKWRLKDRSTGEALDLDPDFALFRIPGAVDLLPTTAAVASPRTWGVRLQVNAPSGTRTFPVGPQPMLWHVQSR